MQVERSIGCPFHSVKTAPAFLSPLSAEDRLGRASRGDRRGVASVPSRRAWRRRERADRLGKKRRVSRRFWRGGSMLQCCGSALPEGGRPSRVLPLPSPGGGEAGGSAGGGLAWGEPVGFTPLLRARQRASPGRVSPGAGQSFPAKERGGRRGSRPKRHPHMPRCWAGAGAWFACRKAWVGTPASLRLSSKFA